MLPVNSKGQFKITKTIQKMHHGNRRTRIWLANNEHMIEKEKKMDHRVLNIHHRRLDLRAFVKESLRGHQERRLASAKDYKKMMLERELAHLE